MAEQLNLGDIFDIPERVYQGDLVLKLTDGVAHPEATLAQYVVTDQLAESFRLALDLIQSALETNRSKAAFLHGSFGSGKSHFMAVLSLLLSGNTAARRIPRLAPVVNHHASWLQERRVLVLPYHMIGVTSMESAILGGYAEWARRHHPDKPAPALRPQPAGDRQRAPA
ncbi:MAG: DUF6079 family protein [Gammaproteobacteria bacterium]|nr:DUF6079 family protein [Gammaproteobacteria bacterium]